MAQTAKKLVIRLDNTGHEAPLRKPQRRLPIALDIASWVIVPFWIGQTFWNLTGMGDQKIPAPPSIMAALLVWFGIGLFFAFGACWLILRATRGLSTWWRPFAVEHPLGAGLFCALVPACALSVGYIAGEYLPPLLNYLYFR